MARFQKYKSWYGKKPLAQGSRANIGKMWHPQLSGKTAVVRDHGYWLIENIHDKCDQTSPCRQSQYIPSLTALTEAVKLLSNFLHGYSIYNNPEDYVLSQDTFYVESFNTFSLMNLLKHVHIKNMRHYDIGMSIGIPLQITPKEVFSTTSSKLDKTL